ncbi:MAG: flagellar regulator YcgR PilZN domain-containing protein [Gallionella sp.]|nr:flagellar regulator YcgR PilZN domain-containing protein [Gallionella sp.]
MIKRIPPKIEVLSDEESKSCLVSFRQQIESILLRVAQSGTDCALYYDASHNFIMTTILDVDEDGLWIEPGNSATTNALITSSRSLTLVSQEGNVKIQFTVDKASPVSYDGAPALFLFLPKALLRIQRREFFRLLLPPTERLQCNLGIRPSHDGEPLEMRHMTVIDFELPAADISGGGIGLLQMEDESGLHIGQTYPDCRIELSDEGAITANLIVRNIVILGHDRVGQTIFRVGCEFKNLDAEAANKLHKFITGKQAMTTPQRILMQ